MGHELDAHLLLRPTRQCIPKFESAKIRTVRGSASDLSKHAHKTLSYIDPVFMDESQFKGTMQLSEPSARASLVDIMRHSCNLHAIQEGKFSLHLVLKAPPGTKNLYVPVTRSPEKSLQESDGNLNDR